MVNYSETQQDAMICDKSHRKDKHNYDDEVPYSKNSGGEKILQIWQITTFC